MDRASGGCTDCYCSDLGRCSANLQIYVLRGPSSPLLSAIQIVLKNEAIANAQ